MGIGTKLTKLMKEQNTNANELAKKAGVNAQTIYSLIRRDATKVDIDSLIKIARALGTTAEFFSNEVPDESIHTVAAHFDGDKYTDEQLDRIKAFAAFIKSEDKKQ